MNLADSHKHISGAELAAVLAHAGETLDLGSLRNSASIYLENAKLDPLNLANIY